MFAAEILWVLGYAALPVFFVLYAKNVLGLSTGVASLWLACFAVVAGLVSLDVYGLPADSLDTYRARVSEVTVEQTHRVAQELLHPSRAAIVLLGPADVLAPQFEDMGQIEVVRP